MAAAKKLNCWEYQGCGFDADRNGETDSCGCPSVAESALDGANGGLNGGRSCWVIEGTMCDGDAAGDFEEKARTCRKCAFMQRVAVEEGLDFVDGEALVSIYKNGDGS